MAGRTSTMFTVGTLLRHAEDANAPVRVLVSGTWLDGVVVGADGLGIVLDDRAGHQVLVRLDSILAVSFSRDDIEQPETADEPAQSAADARAHGHHGRVPIEAGPVSRH